MSEDLFVQKRVVSLALAKILMAAAEQEVMRHGWSMYVAITDDAGTPVLIQAVNGPQTASFEISLRKARSAAGFRRPTKVWEERVQGGAPNVMTLGMVASEGGVPLMAGGAMVGAIGVSGGTGAEDGVVAKAAVAALAELG